MTDEEVKRCGNLRPDAIYTDPVSNELVAVEADAGQYNRNQILEKITKWVGLRQVWGQAHYVAGRVPDLPNVQVFAV